MTYFDKKSKKIEKTLLDFPEEKSLLFINSMRRASKIQDRTIYIKKLVEFRLFLFSIGVSDFSESDNFLAFMDKHGYTPQSLTALNKENFDNRSYTIDAIEENMDLKLISFMKDIPYSSTVLESIFSLNPYKTTEQIINKVASYGRLSSISKEVNDSFCT